MGVSPGTSITVNKTPNLKPQPPHPKTRTPNPKPQAPSPQPQLPNPKPRGTTRFGEGARWSRLPTPQPSR
ncbi:hypothetical protein T484DRAFT_1638346 [Baffinella frigidus]|nr:hypothetical protein T484DRAFT_1638346 [Cryptophyta sp. CCMP2293]